MPPRCSSVRSYARSANYHTSGSPKTPGSVTCPANRRGAGHCVSPTSTCAYGRTSVSPPTNELRPIPHDLVDRRLPEARDLLEVGGLHEEQALRRVYRAIHQRPDRALAEAPVSKRKRLQYREG